MSGGDQYLDSSFQRANPASNFRDKHRSLVPASEQYQGDFTPKASGRSPGENSRLI